MKNNHDFICNIPNKSDLIRMKRSLIMTMTYERNSLNQILPCIRHLCATFDSICPNIYRIHCSDSLRILNEIICLTDEYLHIVPLPTISTYELLLNENYLNDFISKLRRTSVIYRTYYLPRGIELNCFGQGILSNSSNNQLYRTTLFCCEITTRKNNNLSLPFDVIILDPNENLVLNNVQYINTYNQGYTKLFSCSYTPITTLGLYKITFFYDNIKIKHQQYTVFIHDSVTKFYSYQKQKQLSLFDELIKKPQQGKYNVSFISD